MRLSMLAAVAVIAVLLSMAHAQDEGSQSFSGVNGSRSVQVPAAEDIPYPGVLTLNVDLTDLSRRLFVVHESIPVKPGPLTLLYPEWLPGNHAPRGPIAALAGLIITTDGHPIEWRRDASNVYAFHLQVPPDSNRLDLEFEFASPLVREQGRTVVTPDLLGLQWNTVVLYPAGYYARRIEVAAAVTLPERWDFASALEVEGRQESVIRFKPASLEMLVDSPLFAGRYARALDLDPNGKIPVHLWLFADSPDCLDVKANQLMAHRKLVQEAYALFGQPHYDRYEFLLALSDHFADIGLEHHRSSENRRAPAYLLEWDRNAAGRDLLPHEFSHSWNGKYRRPAGLATPDFNTPMRDSMLWVYEGLTSYYGAVLSVRSGLWSQDFGRQAWASIAANMDRNREGRAWRDLEDTTEQPIITPRGPLSWLSWQRTEDYYPEGELLWLDVDTRIRELTRNKRSLDDFAHTFFSASPAVAGRSIMGPVTYTLSDIVQGLRAVAPFDWEKYLQERLHGHGPGAPLDGLARGGWKLVYTETPSDYQRSSEEQRKVVDCTYSLGLVVSLLSNQLSEVRWKGPAYEAGLTMGTTLIAVNGREYRPERLRSAIVLAKLDKQPIELLVKSLDRYRTVRIEYYDGLQYPQLQRVEKTEDRLAAILKPRTQLSSGAQ